MHHTSHKLLHSVYHNIINFTTKFINAKQLFKNILFFIIIYISVPKVHFWYYEEKVITATSMNEIAKTAGYSKATLYVFFENKEEIIGFLVLDSMKKLYSYITSALEQEEETKTRYDLICRGLVLYQEEFPFYFKMVLDKINIDFENGKFLPEEKETYQIGEEINEKLKDFVISGIKKGDLRNDLKIMPTIFNFWGMLSGLIQFAANKE